MKRSKSIRRICFVTGTRAEFGLMRPVLEAIRDHPKLQLQLVVTGMHLDRRHGYSIDSIRQEGWKIDVVIPWKSTSNASQLAHQTGVATAHLARSFEQLESDIILVAGDRVEPFAAASAAHVSQRIVAHIHGGDRAPGQIDDSLRHAITKLSHIHFPATEESKRRLIRLGEDRWRIHRAGSPGIDGITRLAASPQLVEKAFPNLKSRRFALIVLHPVEFNEQAEFDRAHQVLSVVRGSGIDQTVVIYPNNDPGSRGIIRCWQMSRSRITHLLKDLPRPLFLGLLRDAAVLVGNSSSGIIEAASFGTPVVDIGPRQDGRDRSPNVVNVPYNRAKIRAAVQLIWNSGNPRRWRGNNVYNGRDTGQRIAALLSSIPIDDRLRRKLIAH